MEMLRNPLIWDILPRDSRICFLVTTCLFSDKCTVREVLCQVLGSTSRSRVPFLIHISYSQCVLKVLNIVWLLSEIILCLVWALHTFESFVTCILDVCWVSLVWWPVDVQYLCLGPTCKGCYWTMDLASLSVEPINSVNVHFGLLTSRRGWTTGIFFLPLVHKPECVSIELLTSMWPSVTHRAFFRNLSHLHFF